MIATVGRHCGLSLILGCLLASCITGPEVSHPYLEPFEPPAKYQMWWSLVEQCSGRKGEFGAVQFTKPRGNSLVVNGEKYGGYWWPSGNRIAVVNPNDGGLVRHEMLHALLRDGVHLPEYFGLRCGGLVSFDGGEMAGVPSNTQSAARVAAASLLSVAVTTFPASPSVSQFDGAFELVVTATNVQNYPAWIKIPSRELAAYYIESSVSENGAAFAPESIYFAAGQQRRYFFDLARTKPENVRVWGEYLGVRSPWVTVTIKP